VKSNHHFIDHFDLAFIGPGFSQECPPLAPCGLQKQGGISQLWHRRVPAGPLRLGAGAKFMKDQAMTTPQAVSIGATVAA
jgi:hypothetical protein